MTEIIIVGYTTKKRDDISPVMLPSFKAPSNYKAETAAAWVAAKEEEFGSVCHDMPYYGCLDTLFLVDMASHDVLSLPLAPLTKKFKKGKTAPASLEWEAGQWIIEHWPDAFPNGFHALVPHPPEVIFVGFDPKEFLKLLGTACAEQNNPLPSSLWYENSDHRDIGHALVGDRTGHLQMALARLNCPLFEDPWSYAPHQHAELDTRVIAWACKKLGLY